MPQLQHTEHTFIACFEELSASAALFEAYVGPYVC